MENWPEDLRIRGRCPMQFSPDMVDAILEGRKTRTTRPITPIPEFDANGVQRCPYEDAYAPCHYKVGHDYAVCPGRGKLQVARIRVLSVEPWGSVDHIDSADPDHARKEGFDSRKGFLDKWRLLYSDHRREGPVWVLDFELVKD